MATDFEKQFGDYGDLTDSLGLASAAMQAGQYPNRPIESDVSRIVRLLGKGATFGLAQQGQTPIEAESIPEYAAEFLGSIPSTIAASAVGGPLLGAAVPRLAKLGPVARSVATAGALGSAIGTGRAIQTGDITDIPSEAAWWAGSDIVGQGAIKVGKGLFGRGAKIEPPPVPEAQLHGPPKPTETEREFYNFLHERDAKQKGNVINRILDPSDVSTVVPGEREVFPSPGAKRTMLPPKEMPPGLVGGEGPAVRFVKVGADEVNFDEIPDLVLDRPATTPREKMVELHRAEGRGTTGETFTTDRLKAIQDAKTVDGYLKTIEVPESQLAQYKVGDKYRVPQKAQDALGVGERELGAAGISREIERRPIGKELAKIEAKHATPAEMSLEDELGRTVAGEGPAGPEAPLTEGQVARRAFSDMGGPTEDLSGRPGYPFKVEPPEPLRQPIRRPSLDGFTEKTHENPIRPENMERPLKEAVDPSTGLSMVAPKTAKAASLMDAASRITRNVEPPINAAMKEDLASPLNKAKLDHGVQTEQYKTSKLITKTDEEIERITAPVDGTHAVTPVKFKEVNQNPLSEKVVRNLERQGWTPDEMVQFFKQKTAEWDSKFQRTQNGENIPITGGKSQWMKNEILTELKRRGPC